AVSVAGARHEGNLPLPGENLIEQINKGGEERMLFFEHQGNRAVRHGRWKLVALDDEPWELYDFSVDRVEMNDLSQKYPQRVKKMAAAWDKWGAANQVTPLPRDLKVDYLKAD
ncbi:MAG: hypothetical protein O2983_14630, partial [Planctomycetota bacterium]|nr:hypothetical protein [Planctomycetota bacterium]